MWAVPERDAQRAGGRSVGAAASSACFVVRPRFLWGTLLKTCSCKIWKTFAVARCLVFYVSGTFYGATWPIPIIHAWCRL